MADIVTLGLQDPTQTFQKWYGVTQPLRDMRAQERADLLDQNKLAIMQQNADLERQKLEAEAARKAELQAAFQEASAPNASADSRKKFIMLQDPANADKMATALNSLDEQTRSNMALGVGQVIAAIQNGQPQMGFDILTRQAEGYRASGQEEKAKQTEAIIEAGKLDPSFVTNYYKNILPFFPEGQKVYDQLNENSEQANKNAAAPGDMAKTDAETRKLNAEALKLELDASRPQGTEIDTDSRKIMNTATDGAVSSLLLADQADNLATEFDKLIPPSGFVGKALDFLKTVSGGQDKFTKLQQDYVKLRNTDVLKNLPPGVASDRDIEIALQAFPNESSNPEYISSFLKGTAKLNRYSADVNRSKAEWVNQNGSLGPARSDFTANKLPVTKGTNFIDFTASIPVPNVSKFVAESVTGGTGGTGVGTPPATTPPGGTPAAKPSAKPTEQPKGFTVTAGGKSYSFPDQSTANAFAKKVGGVVVAK